MVFGITPSLYAKVGSYIFGAYGLQMLVVPENMMTDHFNATLYELSAAVGASPIDKGKVATIAASLLQTIDDLDRILATHTSFMVGTWINEARAWGATEAESDHYEWSARNQITLWGPSGRQGTVDYAAKGWSGVTKTYYQERWALFLKTLQASADGVVDQVAFNAAVLAQVEQPWQHKTAKTQPFPSEPSEDALAVAQALHGKYGR